MVSRVYKKARSQIAWQKNTLTSTQQMPPVSSSLLTVHAWLARNDILVNQENTVIILTDSEEDSSIASGEQRLYRIV